MQPISVIIGSFPIETSNDKTKNKEKFNFFKNKKESDITSEETK